MVKIPRFNLSDVISGAPDTPHPMFIVDGVVKDAIYIGKYLSTIWDLRAYSLPGRDPAVNMTLDDAKRYACTKGPGWHVMSNAERAGIALWCKANGYFPYGNTNGGKSAAKPVYRGTPSINTNVGTFSVGDVTKIANANTDDFISFNKSNATEMKIESFEGASLNGTTFVGGKVSCTLDKDIMDKIEKVDFYVNKRADSICDTLNLLPGINQNTIYNSDGSSQPCVLHEGDTYKMWFTGLHSGNSIMYTTSKDLVNWTTPIVSIKYGTSPECSINACMANVINDNGTYRIWFMGYDGSHGRILHATSNDGINWSTPTVVLNYGINSTNTIHNCEPCVIKDGITYKMWYTSSGQIYYTASRDGATWSTAVLVMATNTCPYNTSYSTHPSVVKESDSSYRLWFHGGVGSVNSVLYCTSSDGLSWSTPTKINCSSLYNKSDSYDGIRVIKDGSVYRMWTTFSDGTINRLVYSESPDGVNDWSTDITSPIKLRNLTYTATQNSGDGYINSTITSIQPGYQVNTAFEFQSTGVMNRVPMRNAKRIQFEIRSAASKDGKTPAKVLFGYFATNGNIQDIYVQSNSRSGGDGSTYIYSKSGVNLIAKVTPTGYVVSGSDGCINADGIYVVSAACVDSNDKDDAYAKINVVDVYGDTDITRTLTGTCGTGHDGSIDGIMDLTGNIWELITGVKIIGGKILITPDNDSATQFYSDKYYWSAIDQGGNLIDPNDAGALYYDGAAGATTINTKVTTQIGTAGASTSFKALTAASGVAVPTILKALGLFPVDGNDHGDSTLKYKTTDESYAMFGGDANSMMANGGLFTLSFLIGQGIVSPSAGFRVCYYNP